ncbi:iron-siderophore ABC transporter substrate-binding protein [Kitasatospora sp. NBC_01287]|uniref:ABC transporter substrate-binding protein n=1 Tax=Kitasatospora sp. NBC_01287 TaxID=2903573 RepID=UPI00225B983D|nr:iron-siderophore ABC transporter substrate-binding protein [Kitasatospora sp. NBC_01287]MCX4747335.1 iron-siderophore ABC transporter substrate-binding protein [Kitasatospora sp. NBC_01287]
MHRHPSRRAVLAAGLAATLGACGPTPGLPAPQAAVGAAGPEPSAVVTAATGAVAVPGLPTRVVVLDTAELDSAMTLGITPIGACRAAEAPGLPRYWPASRLAEVAVTGTIGAPDLAAIEALRPELILSSRLRDGGRYEALRRIAPTVLTRTTGATWKENFQLHARALGRQAEADAVIAAYRTQLAETSRMVGGPGATAGRKVSLVRFVQGGRIRLYGRQSFPGSLLTDLGLGRPDAQNVDQFDTEVKPDQLSGADGDLLLYSTYGDPDAAGTTATLAGPAWRALGAVRAGRAFPVDDQLWFEGIGCTGAGLVLSQLQCLLGF